MLNFYKNHRFLIFSIIWLFVLPIICGYYIHIDTEAYMDNWIRTHDLNTEQLPGDSIAIPIFGLIVLDWFLYIIFVIVKLMPKYFKTR